MENNKNIFFTFQVGGAPAPLNMPTPTPAPDQGGPVTCLGGPVACLAVTITQRQVTEKGMLGSTEMKSIN